MYLINPLCKNKEVVAFDGSFFPHLFESGGNFYAERQGNNLYVETTLSETDLIKQRIRLFESEEL